MKHYIRFIGLTIIFLCTKACAQNALDSSFADAIAVYKKTLGANTHLYKGRAYTDYDHRITGTPFFNDSYFAKGSIMMMEFLITMCKCFMTFFTMML